MDSSELLIEVGLDERSDVTLHDHGTVDGFVPLVKTSIFPHACVRILRFI